MLSLLGRGMRRPKASHHTTVSGSAMASATPASPKCPPTLAQRHTTTIAGSTSSTSTSHNARRSTRSSTNSSTRTSKVSPKTLRPFIDP